MWPEELPAARKIAPEACGESREKVTAGNMSNWLSSLRVIAKSAQPCLINLDSCRFADRHWAQRFGFDDRVRPAILSTFGDLRARNMQSADSTSGHFAGCDVSASSSARADPPKSPLRTA
jgi:hypothetical protein